MTTTLSEIGKGVAQLKSNLWVPVACISASYSGNFAGLRHELEKDIKECMKRVVADETFMKQEMHGMDTCLRRCKNLAEVRSLYHCVIYTIKTYLALVGIGNYEETSSYTRSVHHLGPATQKLSGDGKRNKPSTIIKSGEGLHCALR